jgi:hypothetical protein
MRIWGGESRNGQRKLQEDSTLSRKQPTYCKLFSLPSDYHERHNRFFLMPTMGSLPPWLEWYNPRDVAYGFHESAPRGRPSAAPRDPRSHVTSGAALPGPL